MQSEKSTGFFSNLKYDLPASLVVFFVAVPLCLGIALASGAPLFSGIIAGIVGGIVVSLISGSPLGVSGPAAGLAVIVLNAITDLGAFDTFLVAVVLAGLIQIILGILKAGVIGYYFPNSVIKGMLSGIGIIIILKQIPHAFGYDADPEGDFAFFQTDGHNTFSELFYMLNYISPSAVIISVISLVILILWERPFMKKLGFTGIIQGPLVAVSSAIGMNLLFQNIGFYPLTAEQMVSIPVAGSVSGFFSQFTFPNFSMILDPQVLLIAFTIAVVASLETLLCVEATDKLDPQKRVTPTNRELIAQGVGNMASGLIGGLPVTQVIVRSSANIQSGGRTKASAFFHGVIMLLCALAIPKVLNMIPLASLAAILFVVGFKLAKPTLFKEMMKSGWSQFIPFMVTILGIVFTDLLIGIGLGMAVAVIQILWHNFKTPFYFDVEKHAVGAPITIELSEHVSFLNKAGIMRTLHQIPEGATVKVDASRTTSMHPDIREIFNDFATVAEAKGITIDIGGLQKLKVLDPIKEFDSFIGENGNAYNSTKSTSK